MIVWRWGFKPVAMEKAIRKILMRLPWGLFSREAILNPFNYIYKNIGYCHNGILLTNCNNGMCFVI